MGGSFLFHYDQRCNLQQKSQIKTALKPLPIQGYNEFHLPNIEIMLILCSIGRFFIKKIVCLSMKNTQTYRTYKGLKSLIKSKYHLETITKFWFWIPSTGHHFRYSQNSDYIRVHCNRFNWWYMFKGSLNKYLLKHSNLFFMAELQIVKPFYNRRNDSTIQYQINRITKNKVYLIRLDSNKVKSYTNNSFKVLFKKQPCTNI